jgi:hypothetical protein
LTGYLPERSASRATLLLVAALGAMTVASACSTGKSGGVATATPTPFVATNCQVVWLTASSSAAGTYNAYLIDMPVANWGSSGVRTFGQQIEGIFYYGLDLQQATAQEVGLTTAGTFTVSTSGGTQAGGSIVLSDSQPHSYYDAANPSGGFLATDGVGSFDGVWSNPAPDANPTYGIGTISILYQGSSLKLGQDASLGLCYDQDAFAPEPEAK